MKIKWIGNQNNVDGEPKNPRTTSKENVKTDLL